MKKTILVVLMAIVATTAVTAQESDQRERRGDNSEKRVERQVKRLDKKLQLTDEQKLQIKEIYSEFDKADQARKEQMRLQERKDREALNGKINSILTDEQKAKFADMKSKEKDAMHKERHGGKKGFGRANGPGRGHGPGRMEREGFGGGEMGGEMTD